MVDHGVDVRPGRIVELPVRGVFVDLFHSAIGHLEKRAVGDESRTELRQADHPLQLREALLNDKASVFDFFIEFEVGLDFGRGELDTDGLIFPLVFNLAEMAILDFFIEFRLFAEFFSQISISSQ